jgi:hypothetical protein
MANSIVSTISRLLTPEVVGKLASASGLDRSAAQGAVGAAVPSILGALTDIVTRPGGARQLANAVAEQPADVLAGIGSNRASGDKGSNLLTSLLGGGALGVLTSTVSRFLGVGEGPMRSLMGLLAPVIMAVLGREQRAAGLDANGLAQMLIGQKSEIAAAMPAGLSRLLETNNRPHEEIAAPASPERRAYEAPGTTYTAMPRARSDTTRWGANWPYWVLPLLALAGLLWYLFPNERETDQAATTSKTTSEPSRDVTKSIYLTTAPDNWVSVASTSNDYAGKEVYNRTGEQLGTIKDVLAGPDGKTAAIVINVGRYLGIGDKEIAVPLSALQRQQRDGGQRIVIDASKEVLQAAPSFVRKPSKQ